jgi:hypothetical protein
LPLRNGRKQQEKMIRITRTLRDCEMTHSDDAHTVAVRFLEAERTSRGYRYYAPETGKFYRVPFKSMASLGSRLLEGQDDGYSLWCARTGCVELKK